MIAVVVPIYRSNRTPEEEISLRHLKHFLEAFDIYWVTPHDLKFDRGYFGVKSFDRSFFTNISAYSRLLLSPDFYEAFKDYQYILIYQLDCLVFSDKLKEWCEAGYDYIGAPWFKSKSDPEKGFSRVGNGGLSLRKVESFLRVLNSRRYLSERVPYRHDFSIPIYDDSDDGNIFSGMMKKLRVLRNVRKGVKWYTEHYTLNEDRFWSDRAKLFYPEFKIAPVEAGLKFSFERFPGFCYEQNGHELPFGCHAWAKWDRKFWEQYLLT